MRNSKIRARIAAGKLRLRIRDLRNLGARSEQLLAAIGVRDVEELRRRGAVRAFATDLVAGLCQRLIDGGAPALHFYTLNLSKPTLAVMERLG